MKKLQPVLDLINTLIVNQVQVELASTGEQSLGVKALVSSVLLKTPQTQGLTVEDIAVSLEKLQLPNPDDLNLYLTVVLEKVDLSIAQDFWPGAARLAKNPIVNNLGILVDRVEVRNLRVEVELAPSKIVDLRVRMESLRLKVRNQLMKEVTHLNLEVLDFDLKEKNKKKALGEARVRVQDLKLRIMELMLNRLIEVGRDRMPSKLSSIDIALNDSIMRLTVKTNMLPMSIPIELQLSTRDNLLGIYIVKIFIGLARPLVLKAVERVAAKRREISASGDNIWINPWLKLPIKPQAKIERFTVEGGALVFQLGQLPVEPAPAPPAVWEEPVEEPTSA